MKSLLTFSFFCSLFLCCTHTIFSLSEESKRMWIVTPFFHWEDVERRIKDLELLRRKRKKKGVKEEELKGFTEDEGNSLGLILTLPFFKLNLVLNRDEASLVGCLSCLCCPPSPFSHFVVACLVVFFFWCTTFYYNSSFLYVVLGELNGWRTRGKERLLDDDASGMAKEQWERRRNCSLVATVAFSTIIIRVAAEKTRRKKREF